MSARNLVQRLKRLETLFGPGPELSRFVVQFVNRRKEAVKTLLTGNQLVSVHLLERSSLVFFVAHGREPIQISPRVYRFLATHFLGHAGTL